MAAFWMLHGYSAIFPLMTRDRLKIVLPSFPARFARGKLLMWLVLTFQWGLSLLIALTKISVGGRAVPLYFNVFLAEFTSIFWVIILHEYKSLNYKSRSRWDCRFDSNCPSPGANPLFCN